jgi:hypothetical protein
VPALAERFSARLEVASKRALNVILRCHRKVDGRSGWHQMVCSQKVGTIATAQCLESLRMHGIVPDCSDTALQTIAEDQVLDGNGVSALHGGWRYRTNASEYPTSEATSWALFGLSPHADRFSETIGNGVAWLMSNRTETDEGWKGWGPTRVGSPRVYSTALAVRTLIRLGYAGSEEVRDAVRLLIGIRNADGGWGSVRGSDSTNLHTAHATLALLDGGSVPSDPIIQTACGFLLSRFDPTSQWNATTGGGLLEEMEVFDPRTDQAHGAASQYRVPYYHSVWAWVVCALVAAGFGSDVSVCSAVEQAIANAERGIWPHPLLALTAFPRAWALHDFLTATSNYSAYLADLPRRRMQVFVVVDGLPRRLTVWRKLFLSRPLMALILIALMLAIPALLLLRFVGPKDRLNATLNWALSACGSSLVALVGYLLSRRR